MSRPVRALAAIVIYAVSMAGAVAGDCNAFRADLQSIQQQVRTNEFDKGSVGINAAQEAARLVKSMCLDPLSALDMTAFGFTPGAAAIVTKLAGAACKKLSQEITNKVGQITQQVSQGVSNITGRISDLGNGQVGDLLGQINNGGSVDSIIGNQVGKNINDFGGSGGGGMGSVPPMDEPGLFKKTTGIIQNGWTKLKNLVTPGRVNNAP